MVCLGLVASSGDAVAQQAPAQPAPTPVAAQAAPAVARVVPPPVTGTSIAIRDIDREVTTLSSDISVSYARLQQITGMVLEQSGGGGAQLLIDHQNEMSSAFRLVRATYSLDGSTLATRVDENGSLADQQSFAVYNGRVQSGQHTLTVSLEYQGNGYGIFSYMRGITTRTRSVQQFDVPEGRALRLVVAGYERGGALTSIEDRPAVRYTQTVMTIPEAQALAARSNAAPAPAATSPATPAPAQRP